MNNPTQQIKQMAKNLLKAKSDSSHIKVLHPKRDWSIGMVIAICIVCAITVWNGYTYFANRDGGSADTEIEIANPRYQAALVDEALGLFDAKAAAFDSISSGLSPASVSQTEESVVGDTTSTTTIFDTASSTEVDSISDEEEVQVVSEVVDVEEGPQSDSNEVDSLVTPELSQ